MRAAAPSVRAPCSTRVPTIARRRSEPRAAGAARPDSSDAPARTARRRRRSRPRGAPLPRAGRPTRPSLARRERGRLEDRDRLVGLGEHFLRVDREVRLENLLVHGAEVDLVAELPARVWL